MSMNFGYIYILTNPSMQGLVKVGKTTNTPNQRMSELHSTGVPTPFELEFSISVDDCHKAERLAHKTLNYYRVSANREFFRISVKKAIEQILEVIEEFEVIDFRDSHGINKIEEEVRQRKLLKEEAIRQKNNEIERKNRIEKEKNLIKQNLLNQKINTLRKQLSLLGVRPSEQSPSSWTILSFCYLPIPIGWIFWIGSLQVFGSKNTNAGLVCVVLIFLGYLASISIKNTNKKNEKLLRPFFDLDFEIEALKKDLLKTGFVFQEEENSKNLVDLSSKITPKNSSVAKSQKIISDGAVIRHNAEMPKSISEISNLNRNQFSASTTCPTCKSRVEKIEGQIDFRCLKCNGIFRY